MSKQACQRRRGLTLVEMLVATTVTLLIVFGMVEMFRVLGAQASEGRAVLEMSGQLRSTVHRLQQDLDGITAPVRPWPNAAAAPGYFEVYEGISRDSNAIPGLITATAYGDIDDVLMFTSRSHNEPFVGRWNPLNNNGVELPPAPITSSVAEIAWWTKRKYDGNGNLVDVALFRRALLVVPQLGRLRRFGPASSSNQAQLKQMRALLVNFFSNNDISVRLVPEQVSGGQFVVNVIANSLEDLTKRENRFAHYSILTENPLDDTVALALSRYPYPLQLTPLAPTTFNPNQLRSSTSLQQLVQSGLQEGEDLVTQKVTAFDVQVFDPSAPILRSANDLSTFYVPSDPAWDQLLARGPAFFVVVGHGAFVDLYYDRNNRLIANPVNLIQQTVARTVFSTLPAYKSGLFMDQANHPRPISSEPGMMPCYDTWTVQYENDGLDQTRRTNQNNVNFYAEANSPIHWFSGLAYADSVDSDGDGIFDEGLDEGANNLDDDGINGVDDIGERETSPPYPVPLRGIKVTLRIWDPDSRQVRQVSVVANLTPE